MSPLSPASKPTMYFIGVTTGQSSINRVFPGWAEALELGECALHGIDLPLGTDAARYREIIAFIKRDPLSLGALVTTHKVAVHATCADVCDEIDPLAAMLGEISSLYKRPSGSPARESRDKAVRFSRSGLPEGSTRLHGRVVDAQSGASALAAFMPADHWSGGAEALILGAGGAGTVLAWHLAQGLPVGSRPARLHLADRAAERLEHVRQLHTTWRSAPPLFCHHVRAAPEADALLAPLPAGSLVVNATGLGKDAPGSPITDAAVFPEGGFAWEFNYRGALGFLAQARAQAASRGLHVEDGWTYFLHGWLGVIADVFAREIPLHGPFFDRLARIAAGAR